ncbi:hypothetical protein [Ideonella sp. A 288]|uniref:hypothetical protein n=1 Tax=Ideonella sp. A 288 TaxID=1962181 RepID=UPI000B4AF6A3|nr:hypothetical protein [Ideonella sp. A 288]
MHANTVESRAPRRPGPRRTPLGRAALRATLLALLALLGPGVAARAAVPAPAPASAAALHAKRAELQPQLRANTFGEPLVLRSRELPDRLEGDVYAEVAHPMAAVSASVRNAAAICEILFLHLNIRSCAPAADADGGGVSLLAGPKRATGPGAQYHMDYAVHHEVADASHLRVTLSAAQGPMSTTDYRLVFEAVPIDEGHTFVHFGYAYGVGTLARMAMGMYLATAGRDKIGFTVEGVDASGRPKYVRGERAAVERNVMRYYLALQAHRSVTTGSRDERLQARLRAWFALTERHKAQLHEYDLADYLREKGDDLARAAAAR